MERYDEGRSSVADATLRTRSVHLTMRPRHAVQVLALLGCSVLHGEGRAEDRPWSVRVSVKWALDAGGARPTGRWSDGAEVERTIEQANATLERSGSRWSLRLTEVVETGAASAFFRMTAPDAAEFEAAAKASPEAFAWRDDAVNIYLVEEIAGFGGVCSLPSSGPHRDIVIIDASGILGGSEGWLHELGHYFDLLHTHERDDIIADTIFDPPLPEPYTCVAHDNAFLGTVGGASDADIAAILGNIMSYHCHPESFTPLQLVRMERARRDYRLHVLDPLDPLPAPVARLRVVGGSARPWSPDGVQVQLDASASTYADGRPLTVRWELVTAPAGEEAPRDLGGGWELGEAGIGFGDEDDLTVLSDMRTRYMSVFATRAFVVTDPGALDELWLDISWDDGFAAYLNGAEVARRNLAPGAGPNDPSTESVGTAVREVIDLSGQLGALVAGVNRLSVEVHNSFIGSTDVSLHPVLRGVESGGEVRALIPHRAYWHYRRGSAGSPPAGWKEAAFDPGASRLTVDADAIGSYRVRVTVSTGGDEPRESAREVVFSVSEPGRSPFVRGDCNRDEEIDLSDAIRILIDIFGTASSSECPDACDVDDDEVRTITDAIRLLQHLFRSGPPPEAPWPDAGPDPAGDALGCGP